MSNLRRPVTGRRMLAMRSNVRTSAPRIPYRQNSPRHPRRPTHSADTRPIVLLGSHDPPNLQALHAAADHR